MYQVRLRSRRVQRELDGLPSRDRERIVARLSTLTNDPRPPGCQKLSVNIYRVRVGDYRIIYLVDDGEQRVDVGAVRRRSEKTYQGVEELFRE